MFEDIIEEDEGDEDVDSTTTTTTSGVTQPIQVKPINDDENADDNNITSSSNKGK